MRKFYSISETRNRLADLVRRAERGGEVVIARRGKPVARLISEETHQALLRQRRGIDWGTVGIDTRGFRFDRDEANAR